MDYKQEAERLKDQYAGADCGQQGWCDTEKCPLWGARRGRVDSFCVAETYLDVDYLIEAYECDIRDLQADINVMRHKIGKLKSFKKRFEEYLENRK